VEEGTVIPKHILQDESGSDKAKKEYGEIQ
jgi:hypothetical protein